MDLSSSEAREEGGDEDGAGCKRTGGVGGRGEEKFPPVLPVLPSPSFSLPKVCSAAARRRKVERTRKKRLSFPCLSASSALMALEEAKKRRALSPPFVLD